MQQGVGSSIAHSIVVYVYVTYTDKLHAMSVVLGIVLAALMAGPIAL